MAPPKKRARTSPATTIASSPPPFQSTTGKPATIAELSDLDPWTPAQETALFKLLIHHKPTGIHRHFNMLNIHSSLQSQGLTHSRPSKNAPTAPIEHMLPQQIWEKLKGLYDLETLDEREELHRLSNISREGSAESDNRNTPASQREEWQFTREFALDGPRHDHLNIEQAEDFAMQMFGRRLKSGSEPASSPPLEERSITDDTPILKSKGRGGTKATRNKSRQSVAAAGRRGSRTTTATTSTAGDDDEEHIEEGEAAEGADAAKEKPTRSVRGSTRDATRRGKGVKKKG